jgi:predicted metal-dependent hydrolase
MTDTQKPTIVLTGAPTWADQITNQLAELYDVRQLAQPGNYMNTLIDTRAALVIVNGNDDAWANWTTTPKSSPATRRIPIALISDDHEQRGLSALKGADIALTSQELLKNPLRLVEQYARLPDSALQEQLDCECQQPLPELAQEGVAKFNAGEYYKQHDLFEEQWMNTSGPVRDLYRAVLQVGVAYYQIQRGNYRGALKMLQRSVQWLLILPDTCQGIDVAQLRQDSFAVRAELERLGEARFDEFDTSLIKGVHWQAS